MMELAPFLMDTPSDVTALIETSAANAQLERASPRAITMGRSLKVCVGFTALAFAVGNGYKWLRMGGSS